MITPATAPALDPQLAARLDTGSQMLRSLSAAQLPAVRAELLRAARGITLSDDVERTDVSVPGENGAPAVVMRIHRPKGLADPLPCLYAIHGGGYVLGSYEVEDARLDAWCPRLGMVSVSVDYRLAPETVYPGPLEDCYAGLRWVFEHAKDLGIDQSRIGMMGTSAGGGLAVAAALRARGTGELAIAFQLLSYPMIDDRQLTPSSHWHDVPVWDPASNEFGWRSYLGDRYATDRVPQDAAPARATDLAALPPTFISVGTVDVVCDESVDFAQRLYRAGVPADLRVYAGGPHGLDRRATDSRLSRQSRRDMLEWLTRQFSFP
jgi:acetyl esterase/lipase